MPCAAMKPREASWGPVKPCEAEASWGPVMPCAAVDAGAAEGLLPKYQLLPEKNGPETPLA